MTTTMPNSASDADVVGPPPPFDVELTAALAAARDLLPPDGAFRVEEIPALRERQRAWLPEVTDADLQRDGAFAVSERVVPGPAGAPDITLLVCRPTHTEAPFGALYFIHGGGMVMGDRRLGITMGLEVAEQLGLALISVEYRLAPEHPHPAPVEDCYAGLQWTFEHADELGVDADRIVIVGGSAGGGLAAGTALLARDRGGPPVAGQMLHSPVLDARNTSNSSRQFEGLGIWDRTANQMGWTALLGDRQGGPDVSPYASPARATDLSGLPPTFIDVGSCETFRDEAVDYATRLWEAGGQAELHVWPGGFHGFAGFAPQAAISQAALAPVVPWLRRLLSA
ncbi:MAG TPA: alpha/beta hydrolase [Pseudonocardiaceae bacterium]